MFQYIISWVLFVISTLIPVLLFVDYHLNVKKDMFKMAAFRALGVWGIYDKRKLLVVLVVWVVSGWYLFG